MLHCKSEGTRFMPVIVLWQFVSSDTLFILAAVPRLFLSALSGLREEAFWLSLNITQYPTITTITRYDAFVTLFPFKVSLLSLFFSLNFLSPASESLVCSVYSMRCATLAVTLLCHVTLNPVVTYSKCHQHPQLVCTPGFSLVGFFLSLQFISLHNLLSNQVIQNLFGFLHGTLVDAVHQFVFFLMYEIINSTTADTWCCVSCFLVYPQVSAHILP